MSNLKLKNGVTVPTDARALKVAFDDDYLHCELIDGRIVSVPIIWYPRLWNATSEHRNNYEIIGEGYGIHWPAIDEDLSIKGFLSGVK
jgi:hypothetical protein